MAITLLRPFNLNLSETYVFSNITTSSSLIGDGNVNFSNSANVSLGTVANVHIAGGTANYVLSTDGTGNLSWVAQTGGGGSSTSISNGTSNVNIPAINGNVTVSVAGNANIAVFTGTGVNVAGTLNVTGNANVGNIGATNGVFTNISGNGSALTSITGSNVSGQVGNALVAGTVYTAAQPNITSVGLLTALSVGPNSSITLTGTSGYVKANSLQGTDGVNSIYLGYNGVTGAAGITSNLTVGIGAAGHITANGNVTATYFTGAFTTAASAQPNITSVGELSNLTSNGTVNFTNTSNVSLGAVGNLKITGGSANYVLQTDGSGNLSWAAQSGGSSSIISNGTSNVSIPAANGNINLSASGNANVVVVTGTGINIEGTLNATGNFTAGNISTSGSGGNLSGANYVIANFFSGNGSTLTSLTGANVTGAVAFATTANSVAGANVSGQVGNALVAGTVYTNAQPNITSVGTLSNLNVSGNAVIGGNLTVDGNLVYVNVTDLSVEDPIIQLQTGPNAAAPTSNSGKDVGTALNYYDTAARIAFMGWDVSNAEFGFGNTVSITSEVVTFSSYGNVRAGYFIGNGSQLTDIASAAYANYISNGTSNVNILTANGNITVSVNGNANIVTVTGTGANIAGTLNATGNANVGNIGATNGVFTNVSGNGSALSSLTGSNVTGQVGNALVAGTVYTNAQPNITSIGTLSSLTSNGTVNFTNASNVSLGAVGNIKITGGTADYVLRTDGAGNLSWVAQSGGGGGGASISNGTSNVNIATADGNVTVGVAGNANIAIFRGTGVNISGTLNVTGNANTGNIGAINGVFTNVSGNGSTLTSITGANVTGTVANATHASTANTVTTAAQPNITSVGLLTSLSVGPNSSITLTGTSGYVKANSIQGTDGVNAIYPGYDGVTGAAGITSNLTVGIGAAGHIVANGNVTANYFTGVFTTSASAQPNIATVGTLSNLTSIGTVNFTGAGNVSLGAVGNIKITGGTANYVLSTDGSGNLSWVAQSGGGGGSANIAVLDQGNVLTNTVSSINFTGNGVSATANGNAVTVTITASSGGGGGGDFVTRTYTGDGTTTTYTVTNGVTENSILVMENGIVQEPASDYTVSGSSLTFSTAPTANMAIQVRELSGGSANAQDFLSPFLLMGA